MNILKTYRTLLHKHPLLIHSVQTGFLVGLGDVICQTAIEKKIEKYDYIRSAKFFTLGTLIGPSIHTWYTLMEKRLGTTGVRVGLTKVILDQGMFAPIFLVIFMVTISAMQGLGVESIEKKIKNDYLDILTTNYKVWPLVQLVNFFLVPLHYRVLLMQSVALGWNTYLSWKLNSNLPNKI